MHRDLKLENVSLLLFLSELMRFHMAQQWAALLASKPAPDALLLAQPGSLPAELPAARRSGSHTPRCWPHAAQVLLTSTKLSEADAKLADFGLARMLTKRKMGVSLSMQRWVGGLGAGCWWTADGRVWVCARGRRAWQFMYIGSTEPTHAVCN